MTLILSPCLYFVSTNDFAHDLPNFVEYTGKGLELESLHNYLTNLKMQCKDLWIIVPENLGIALRLYENIFCWERKNWCLFSEQIVGWKREWRLRELRAPEKTWLRSNSSSFKMPAPKRSIILSFSCIHLTYFVARGMTTIKHASTPLPKETEFSSASLQQPHYVFWIGNSKILGLCDQGILLFGKLTRELRKRGRNWRISLLCLVSQKNGEISI